MAPVGPMIISLFLLLHFRSNSLKNMTVPVCLYNHIFPILFCCMILVVCGCNNTVEYQGRRINITSKEHYESGALHYIRMNEPAQFDVGGMSIDGISTWRGCASCESEEKDGNVIGYSVQFYESGEVKGLYPVNDVTVQVGNTILTFRKMGYLTFYKNGSLRSGILNDKTSSLIGGNLFQFKPGYRSFFDDGKPLKGILHGRHKIMCGGNTFELADGGESVPIKGNYTLFYKNGNLAAAALSRNHRVVIHGRMMTLIDQTGGGYLKKEVKADSDFTESAGINSTISFYENGAIKNFYYLQTLAIKLSLSITFGQPQAFPVLIELDETGVVKSMEISIVDRGGQMSSGSFTTEFNTPGGDFDPPSLLPLESTYKKIQLR